MACDQLVGEVAPLCDAPQPFVQHDDGRRLTGPRTNPTGLQSDTVDGESVA